MMTKTDLLTLLQRPRQAHPVDLPGGQRVYVRELTTHERTQYEMFLAGQNIDAARERLLSLCICDEAGSRVFDDSDTEAIGNLPSSIVEPAFIKAREINAMGGSDGIGQ